MRIEPAKKKVSELFPIQGAIRYDIPVFRGRIHGARSRSASCLRTFVRKIRDITRATYWSFAMAMISA